MSRAHVRTPAKLDANRMYRRRIDCPACGWHLIDACTTAKIDIINVKEEIPPWDADFVARCQRCKNDYAIRKN